MGGIEDRTPLTLWHRAERAICCVYWKRADSLSAHDAGRGNDVALNPSKVVAWLWLSQALIPSNLSTHPHFGQMDGGVIFTILFLSFLLLAATSPLWLTAYIAFSTTRKWHKQKARRSAPGFADAEPESDPLVADPGADHEEENFLDSEDEAYYQAQQDQERREREEKQADWRLSTRAKFWKEFKRVWRSASSDEVKRERERKEVEERRKIAREAVREYLRLERRRARRVQARDRKEGAMELPVYGNAFVERAKE